MQMTISVVIPTLEAEHYLPLLIAHLRRQTALPKEIIIVDSSSTDRTVEIARNEGCTVKVICRDEYNHGGTRNVGAEMATGEILVFMTQDAQPANERYVEELVGPIREGRVVATYARQLPKSSASAREVFTRNYNYPAQAHVKTKADIPRMGIKAFFLSNVASAWNRTTFWSLGGFPPRVILNEDMLLCAKGIRSGECVAYQATAAVFHSHNYKLSAQFRRYFDIGVSIASAGDLLEGAKSGGEGIKFALRQIGYLLSSGHWREVPSSLAESAVKWIAFHLGANERHLSVRLKRKLSMHSFFWRDD